jgi:lipopolysaccharide export system ATP-binding protein
MRKRASELERLLEEFGLARLRSSPRWRFRAASGGARKSRARWRRALDHAAGRAFRRHRPLSIADIRHLVKDLKRRGIGVLITDHNVRETLDICDRGCIIYGGQVLFAGTPEALVADENVRRLYLGEGFTL